MSRFEKLLDKIMRREWLPCDICSGKKRIKVGESGRFSSVSKVCSACKGKGKVLKKK